MEESDKTNNENEMDKITKYLVEFEKNSPYSKNIFRPLSIFKYYINNINSPHSNKKIGLVLCHGHNHGIETIKNIRYINYWYFIDADSYSYPDYVCDITDVSALKYFPDDFFDCIVTAYCPIGHLIDKYFILLNNLKRTLKKKSFFFSTEFEQLYFWFLDESIVIKITNYLTKHTNLSELEKFKKEFDYRSVDGLDKFIQDYIILAAYYKYFNPSLLKKIARNKIKLILKKNGFKFVKLFKKYLAFCPLKN